MQKTPFLQTLFASAVVSLLSCDAHMPPTGCLPYRTGTFVYKVRDAQNPSILRIERDDSTQTETVSTTGDRAVFSIAWVDSCLYLLRFKEIVSNESDSVVLFKKSMTIKIGITGGSKGYYLFESSNDKNGFVLKDTIWRAD